MQMFEFETEIQNHLIRIPPELEAKLPEGGHYRVILLATDDERTWKSATEKSFLAGYAASDSIYDKL
jgi:hypothetical protein